MTWCPPNITLKWGAYFSPDAEDDAKIVDTAIKAHDAGLVTLRTAVERIQRTFSIENVDQFVDALEKERAEKQKRLADDMHAMAGSDDEDASDAGRPDANVAGMKPDEPK